MTDHTDPLKSAIESKKGFEAWARREGVNLQPARDDTCEDGRFPATYYYAPTETAWRAWANKPSSLTASAAAKDERETASDCDKLAVRALAKSFRENPREASVADEKMMRQAAQDPITQRTTALSSAQQERQEPTYAELEEECRMLSARLKEADAALAEYEAMSQAKEQEPVAIKVFDSGAPRGETRYWHVEVKGALVFAHTKRKVCDELADRLRAVFAAPVQQEAKPEEVTIGGDGIFAGCKILVDPSLPPDTVEMRGKNRVRLNLTTGEIKEVATPPQAEAQKDTCETCEQPPSDACAFCSEIVSTPLAQAEAQQDSPVHFNIHIPKGCDCQNVQIGSYTNQVELPTPPHMLARGRSGCTEFRPTTCVDRCIAPLVQALWAQGIVTTGCCCGHNEVDGYIGIEQRPDSQHVGLVIQAEAQSKEGGEA